MMDGVFGYSLRGGWMFNCSWIKMLVNLNEACPLFLRRHRIAQPVCLYTTGKDVAFSPGHQTSDFFSFVTTSYRFDLFTCVLEMLTALRISLTAQKEDLCLLILLAWIVHFIPPWQSACITPTSM